MDETDKGPGLQERPTHSYDFVQGHGLNDQTQKRIGLHLRAMYDTVVQQPVPDRFRDLIAKLDASFVVSDGEARNNFGLDEIPIGERLPD